MLLYRSKRNFLHTKVWFSFSFLTEAFATVETVKNRTLQLIMFVEFHFGLLQPLQELFCKILALVAMQPQNKIRLLLSISLIKFYMICSGFSPVPVCRVNRVSRNNQITSILQPKAWLLFKSIQQRAVIARQKYSLPFPYMANQFAWLLYGDATLKQRQANTDGFDVSSRVRTGFTNP